MLSYMKCGKSECEKPRLLESAFCKDHSKVEGPTRGDIATAIVTDVYHDWKENGTLSTETVRRVTNFHDKRGDSKVDVGRETLENLIRDKIEAAARLWYASEPKADLRARLTAGLIDKFEATILPALYAARAAAPDSKVAEHEMNLFPHNKATGRWCLACTKSGVAQSASVRKRDIDLARDWLDHKCSEEGCGYKYNYECLAEQLLTKIRLAEREAAASAVQGTEEFSAWWAEHGAHEEADYHQSQMEEIARKASAKSPSALSLDYLAKGGWTCWVVEKRLPIPGRHITQDCYNFADILAYNQRSSAIALVQTTSAAHHAERKGKILSNPYSAGWKKAGGAIFLHSWGKNGLREESL